VVEEGMDINPEAMLQLWKIRRTKLIVAQETGKLK
jgi:hypothetical protein